jgi:hypothetical protein
MDGFASLAMTEGAESIWPETALVSFVFGGLYVPPRTGP